MSKPKTVYSPAITIDAYVTDDNPEVPVLAMPPGPRCNHCGEMLHYTSPKCDCGKMHSMLEWYDWYMACEEIRMDYIVKTNECLIETVIAEGPFRPLRRDN